MNKMNRLNVALLAATVAVMLPAFVRAQETGTAATRAEPGTLSVKIEALRSHRGTVRVLLFDAAKDGKGKEGKGYPADQKAAKSMQIAEIKNLPEGVNEVTVLFPNLAPGTYAIAALHDENNNGKMDTHWYGKPKEGAAASNNPRPKNRAPRFGEAKFELPDAGKVITARMQYP